MALRTHPQVQPFKQHVILSSAARFFDLQENWLENVGNVFPKKCPKMLVLIGFFHGRKVLQKQTSPRQTKIHPNLVHEAGLFFPTTAGALRKESTRKVSGGFFVFFHSRKSTNLLPENTPTKKHSENFGPL